MKWQELIKLESRAKSNPPVRAPGSDGLLFGGRLVTDIDKVPTPQPSTLESIIKHNKDKTIITTIQNFHFQ